MQQDSFQALVLEKHDAGVEVQMRQLGRADLPAGDVLVAVEYSDLNYKDGLAVTNSAPVVRSFPMVPGIDFAGTVVESQSSDYSPGDRVVLTGWGVGETHWGGYAQMARVQAGWLVPLPAGLSTQHAMAIGTAGFTAMLCVLALEQAGLQPGTGEVLVTGASGGVGSVAVAILAHLGYAVIAVTGKTAIHDYLRSLGATDIIGRADVASESKRPLEKTRWAGAVDTVGGDMLAGVLRTMRERSSVAACGNAGGAALNTTVLPFILRGVNLLGIESVRVPLPERRKVWERLVTDLPGDTLTNMMQMATLADVPALGQQIIKGEVHGRVVIDLNS